MLLSATSTIIEEMLFSTNEKECDLKENENLQDIRLMLSNYIKYKFKLTEFNDMKLKQPCLIVRMLDVGTLVG